MQSIITTIDLPIKKTYFRGIVIPSITCRNSHKAQTQACSKYQRQMYNLKCESISSPVTYSKPLRASSTLRAASPSLNPPFETHKRFPSANSNLSSLSSQIHGQWCGKWTHASESGHRYLSQTAVYGIKLAQLKVYQKYNQKKNYSQFSKCARYTDESLGLLPCWWCWWPRCSCCPPNIWSKKPNCALASANSERNARSSCILN